LNWKITKKDLIKYSVGKEEAKLAYDYSRQAMIGGQSNIRGQEERQANLSMDQFIGVGLGELVGNTFFYSLDHYVQTREEKNTNPRCGDDGCDTLGWKIDYKTSWAKKANFLGYNLLVREKERHADHVYVLQLVWTFDLGPHAMTFGQRQPEVYLVGWATDAMLPKETKIGGPFDGAYCLPATELYPIRLLKKYRDNIVRPVTDLAHVS
jgi:hypothetical protein